MQSRLSFMKRAREKERVKLVNKRNGLKLEIIRLRREMKRDQQYVRHHVTLALQPKDAGRVKERLEKRAAELKRKEIQLASIEKKLER